jgi:hypothetical protein
MRRDVRIPRKTEEMAMEHILNNQTAETGTVGW